MAIPKKKTTVNLANAIITIRNADQLTEKQTKNIQIWLRNSARFLTSKDVEKSGLSKRVTFRLFM